MRSLCPSTLTPFQELPTPPETVTSGTGVPSQWAAPWAMGDPFNSSLTHPPTPRRTFSSFGLDPRFLVEESQPSEFIKINNSNRVVQQQISLSWMPLETPPQPSHAHHVFLGPTVIFGLGSSNTLLDSFSVSKQAGHSLLLYCQVVASAERCSLLILWFTLVVHLLTGRAWEAKKSYT